MITPETRMRFPYCQIGDTFCELASIVDVGQFFQTTSHDYFHTNPWIQTLITPPNSPAFSTINRSSYPLSVRTLVWDSADYECPSARQKLSLPSLRLYVNPLSTGIAFTIDSENFERTQPLIQCVGLSCSPLRRQRLPQPP